MYYRFVDGKTFHAEDNFDLVVQMRNDSRTVTKSIHDFMMCASRWCSIYNKAKIRYDNVDNFVEDLVGFNICRRLEVV